MPAFAYLRKSSVHDAQRTVSYEVQLDAVRSLAARSGDDLADERILSDWDKSGRLGADKRPGYAALLAAIESGECTAVYSYSLSRLARSVRELSRLIDDCSKRNVPVRLDVDKIDTSTASGRLLTHVLASVAQFESDVASERVRDANAAKLARGETLSTVKCYGESEGEDAALVIAAFREAGSYGAAAKLLNERGIKPRGSTRGWWPSSVRVVIHRLLPDEVRFVRRGARAAGPRDFVLSGLLRCPTCGTRLTGVRDRGGNRVRYSCRLGTALPHRRVSISEHLLLPAIQADIERHLRLQGDSAELGESDEAKRQDLEAQRTRIIDLYVAGHLDRVDREQRLAQVHAALEALELKRTIVPFPDVAATWQLPPRELNNVLRSIVLDVKLDPETFQPVAYAPAVPEWWAA